jgi:carbon storage regulator
MLIISRKKDQKIIVADEIEITILEVGRNRVRFGIKAPKNIPIHTRLKDSPPTEKIVELKVDDPQQLLKSLPAAASHSKRSKYL